MPKSYSGRGAIPWLRVLRRGFFAAVLIAGLSIAPGLRAQQTPPASTGDTNLPAGTKEEQIASLQLQLTNAWTAVLKIVNQPVASYARKAGMRVGMYGPGWFHPGAMTPDFNNVDVRQSQDLSFAKHDYVTSDVTPGVVFLGRDLEFNPMTKLFYTNRSLPKHRLTEAQMVEVNRLYRIIGHCQDELNRLQTPAYVEKPSTNVAEGEIIPGQSFEAIRKIPLEKRALYAGIAIGALLVLVVVLKVFRGRSA